MIKISNNTRFILNIVAIAIMIYGIAMIPCIILSFLRSETRPALVLLVFSTISTVAGLIIHNVIDHNVRPVLPRTCYMTIIFTWASIITMTAATFMLSIEGSTISDSLLLSSASLTGTGIIIYDISSLPLGLLLWHSILNWLGGIGLIMTTMSILRTWGFLGKGLATSEFPGPTFLKKTPLFGTGYRKLVLVYICLTILHFALLMIAGMPFKYAILTSLSNISTAGMSHVKYGIITNYSIAIKVIITIFALLGSINGNIFLLILKKNYRSLRHQSEILFYILRILITAAIMIYIISSINPSMELGKLIGDVIMQIVSVFSTSGYTITDTSAWPAACVMMVLFQMAIGACSVSTGGGIKNARIIIALKTLSFDTFRHIHPHSVRSITFNNEPLKSGYVLRANIFIALFMTTLFGGAMLLSLDNIDVSTAINYAQAMITNTGTYIGAELDPGLSFQFSEFSKIIMSFLMIAGRLEIYPFIMIFMPSFWSSDNTK